MGMGAEWSGGDRRADRNPLPVDAVRPSRFRLLVLYSTLRRRNDVDAVTRQHHRLRGVAGEGISGRNQNPIHEWPSERGEG